MKILFLTPFVPSMRAGGENFTRLLLDDLSKEHDIDLIYYRYKDDPYYEPTSDRIKVLKVMDNSTFVKLKNCIKHPTYHPVFTVRFDSDVLNFVIKRMEKTSYDIVYLDHSQMYLYGKYLEGKKILMAHDVMGQRYERTGSALLRKLVLNSEGKMFQLNNSTVFSFSDKDQAIIKRLYGVDSQVTHFFLDNMVVKASPSKIENRLIFFGKWKRPDNYEGLKWFFENVAHLLSDSIKVSIIGGWLPEEFQKQYVDGTRVQYLGFVDDPYQLIADSIAVISPLFSGAGVKVKVVESLACGVPVVGNDIAFEGIGQEFGQFMLHADKPEEYVSRVKEVMDISLEQRMQYKHDFMQKYSEDSITEYIKKHLQ